MNLTNKDRYTIHWLKWIKKYSRWLQFICAPNDEHLNLRRMKQLGISILLSCIMLSGCTKESIKIDALSSHNTTSANWYELSISVIADKDTVLDRDACSSDVGRILRTFKIKKNVEVTDNGKIII